MSPRKVDLDALRARIACPEILAANGCDVPTSRRRVPCPIHGGEGDNFSLTHDGKRWTCWSHCGSGDVFDLYARLRGCSIGDAIRQLAGNDWNSNPRPARMRIERCADRDDTARTAAAMRVWRASRPATGTPVEAYLHGRGLMGPAPDRLRYYPNLRHPSGVELPAMVALVTRGLDDAPIAIHRTFLAQGYEPRKAMLGPVRGGAVRLGSMTKPLVIAEGIETALSCSVATGLSAWAALSTSGLRRLALPESATDVVVVADGDKPGEEAATDAATRWVREGRNVRLARMPHGLDANDVLLGRVA